MKLLHTLMIPINNPIVILIAYFTSSIRWKRSKRNFTSNNLHVFLKQHFERIRRQRNCYRNISIESALILNLNFHGKVLQKSALNIVTLNILHRAKLSNNSLHLISVNLSETTIQIFIIRKKLLLRMHTTDLNTHSVNS